MQEMFNVARALQRDILQTEEWAFSGSLQELKNTYGPRREKTCLRGVCEQHGRRPACASAQSDQRPCYSLIGKYHI